MKTLLNLPLSLARTLTLGILMTSSLSCVVQAENTFQIKNTTPYTYQVGLSQALVKPGGQVAAGTQTKALDTMKPLGPNRELTENKFNITLDPANTIFVIIKPPQGKATKGNRDVAVFKIQPGHLIYLELSPHAPYLFTTGDGVIPQAPDQVLEQEFVTGLENVKKTDYTSIEQNEQLIRAHKL